MGAIHLELVTRQQADTLFTAILILGVVVAIAAGLVARARGGRPVPAALGWGGPPVLMGILWRLYNAIADGLGLDTVRNLFAVIALFVVVGIAGGVAWSFLSPADSSTDSGATPHAAD